MEWKPYYRAELESGEGARAVAEALERHAEPEPVLVETLRGGGVLSFPHTTIFASAGPIARAVAALSALRPERVVALGVLHGAAMAEPQRGLHEAYASWLASGAPPDSLVEEIFRELGGAFFARAPLVTPWGEVTAAEPGAEDEWLRERPALLAREFSLDLFLGVLAAAVRAGAVPALPVLPIYVLLTRDPRASFAVARHLAARLPAAEAGRTALVTTGDLVHFGHAYSAPEEMARRPSEEPALTAHFRAEVEAALTLGLGARDYEGFYRRSLAVLGNDQRNVLPVVAERLGPGAAHQLVSFALTDYSRIRGVDRPCVVASALVRYFSTSRQFS